MLCSGSRGHHTRPPCSHTQLVHTVFPTSPPLHTPGSFCCALDSEPLASGVWGGRPRIRALDQECCHSGPVLSVRQKQAAEAQRRREGGYISSLTLPSAPQGLLLTNSSQAACVLSTPTVLHTILAAPILKH